MTKLHILYLEKACHIGEGHLISCYHQAMLKIINAEKEKDLIKSAKV